MLNPDFCLPQTTIQQHPENPDSDNKKSQLPQTIIQQHPENPDLNYYRYFKQNLTSIF